ncbi:hypothetical protein [Nocardia sp. BSTN01]|uniref:hypothetical protein n=1 Tax=Nocardia sp. BSTN01 TaxID=2783665 RepID=UPI00272ED8E1|nr:hypothetical protein [Nocardia sp. BSTN01]
MSTAVGATMGLDTEYRVVSDGGPLHLVDHRYAVPNLYSYLVPSSFAAEVARRSVHRDNARWCRRGAPRESTPSVMPWN